MQSCQSKSFTFTLTALLLSLYILPSLRWSLPRLFYIFYHKDIISLIKKTREYQFAYAASRSHLLRSERKNGSTGLSRNRRGRWQRCFHDWLNFQSGVRCFSEPYTLIVVHVVSCQKTAQHALHLKEMYSISLCLASIGPKYTRRSFWRGRSSEDDTWAFIQPNDFSTFGNLNANLAENVRLHIPVL